MTESETILSTLETKGLTRPYLERALDLPVGHLQRPADFETIALLRIIHMFPWMVDVADSGYEPTVAQLSLLQAATRPDAAEIDLLAEKLWAAAMRAYHAGATDAHHLDNRFRNEVEEILKK